MTEKQPVFSIRPETGGYTVMRDDAPLQTPRALPVTVPTEKLAAAIVAECGGQGERLDLRRMPMTQMALTAIDIATNHRGEVIDGIMRHGETELLCHRATEPDDLVAKQNKIWQPFIDWCDKFFDAGFISGAGITPLSQTHSLDGLLAYIKSLDAYRLTGVSEAVGISGSLILGLALIKEYASATAVFEAAELDTLWQANKWGEDPITKSRHDAIRKDLEDCVRWFGLLG